MNADTSPVFAVFGIGVALLLLVGLYGVMTTRNLIRILISLEIVTKGVTLLLILCGSMARQMALAQSLVITAIVIEVVVIAIATGLVLGLFAHNRSVDAEMARNLKG